MTDSGKPSGGVGDGLRVSVVVPVRNCGDGLREMIESLWAQTLDPSRFEIIIVDNLSTDGTPDLVSRMQEASPVNMVYHLMGENNGPAHSRNAGVCLASGEVLAFTDGDCAPCPRWLEVGLEALQEGVGFVSGPVLLKPGKAAGILTRSGMRVIDEHPCYPTANIVYRKSVFLEMGGFDEGLCFQDFRNKRNECADTDLAWRVKKGGWRNVFVREMVVYHEVENERPLDWLLNPFNFYVIPALVKRHPELRGCLLKWRLFLFKENVMFYLLAVGLVLGVAVSLWWLALVVPFVLWAVTLGGPPRSVAGLLWLFVRPVVLAMRQGVICASMVYGSIRFGSLVL